MGLSKGQYIHIHFKDTGIGMSNEVMRKAFDPFFTTKEKGPKRGQGLGLAMVYNIVTRVYKGHIYIESDVGSGTTIHIYLPNKKTGGKIMSDFKCGTETILIIDDEASVIRLAKRFLTDIGYTVMTAGDGEEAIKIFEKEGILEHAKRNVKKPYAIKNLEQVVRMVLDS